jgi:GGDEF domain-containing protein
VLRGGLRTHDHVARYGGAIFSVILLDTTLEEGRLGGGERGAASGGPLYHGKILRLDFSAGRRGGPSRRARRLQELIRRATRR